MKLIFIIIILLFCLFVCLSVWFCLFGLFTFPCAFALNVIIYIFVFLLSI